MHDYIKERTIKIGRCIVETRKTVRTIAKEFGVSKSTVHKDLTERLPEINPDLAQKVKIILEYHKSFVISEGERRRRSSTKNRKRRRSEAQSAQVTDTSTNTPPQQASP